MTKVSKIGISLRPSTPQLSGLYFHLKEIAESGRWWDCRMDFIAEWTFEGSPK